MLSHAGVLLSNTQRMSMHAHELMGVDFWPSLADVVVVEESELAACLARGYPCVPFPTSLTSLRPHTLT